MDPNNPTTLTEFEHEIEAIALLAVLAENGIQGATTGSFTSGFRTEAPGSVSVVVKQCDLPRALKVLAELETSAGEMDWSAVDVGVPED